MIDLRTLLICVKSAKRGENTRRTTVHVSSLSPIYTGSSMTSTHFNVYSYRFKDSNHEFTVGCSGCLPLCRDWPNNTSDPALAQALHVRVIFV